MSDGSLRSQGAPWNPPSSLAEEERLRSLRFHLLAPLAEAGAWWPPPSSLVEDSGAPALVRPAARDSRRSQLFSRVRKLTFGQFSGSLEREVPYGLRQTP